MAIQKKIIDQAIKDCLLILNQQLNKSKTKYAKGGIVGSLMENGKVGMPSNILKMRPVPVMQQMRASLAEGGFIDDEAQIRYLISVLAGGPAAKAGLLANDIILSVNNQPISNMEDFYKTVWSLGGPGSNLNIEVQRSNQKMKFQLTTIDRNNYFVKPKYY